MACQLLRIAAIIMYVKCHKTQLHRLDMTAWQAIDTIMRRPPGRSCSVHWSRVRHVTAWTTVILTGRELGRWVGGFVYQEEGHSP